MVLFTRLIATAGLLLFAPIFVASDLTYWVDPDSCGSSNVNLGGFKDKPQEYKNVKVKFDDSIKEALKMARRAYERLNEIPTPTGPGGAKRFAKAR